MCQQIERNMKTKLELLQSMAVNLNSYTNISQPYFKKFIQITKLYFKQSEISEISANLFSEITGLKKDISLKVLIEINKEIFPTKK